MTEPATSTTTTVVNDTPTTSTSSSADNDSSTSNSVVLTVKWSNSEYLVDELTAAETVADLKNALYAKTSVKPARQKLMGLKTKNGSEFLFLFCRFGFANLISSFFQSGKPVSDDTAMGAIALRPGQKVMMIGSKEEEISGIDLDPSEIPPVVNDFDIEEEDLGMVAIHNREEYLAKIERRVREYKVTVFNEPRPGKKLLVLDIDYTLFGELFGDFRSFRKHHFNFFFSSSDHRSTAEHASQLMRPYLHEFLTKAYHHYDIVIWCKFLCCQDEFRN